MAAKKGYTAEEYQTAIRQAKGNVTEAADALSVSRTAVYDAIRRYKTVEDELEKWRETAITEAEGRLFDAMRNDEQWAIKMVLRNWKPERYTEKRELEHSGPDGEPVQMQWVDPESVDDSDQ